jgi:nitroimidazol reductase NimA-like FMN-containing flavoprotein (pyridoxamine 5'-phosphate oxidase superfamily)
MPSNILRSTEHSVDECLQLLQTMSPGRLVYLVDDKPQIRPLNYGLHQGSVVFRIGYGELLDVIHLQPVLFEVDHCDATTHTWWSVIHGVAEEIWRPEELAIAHEMRLPRWAPGDRDHFVRFLPSTCPGRRTSKSPSAVSSESSPLTATNRPRTR